MQVHHFLVSGRVQGVSFRYFTQKRASSLKIVGWVRNLRDGRVEILAAGDQGALAELETAIARGPLLARVDGIERKPADIKLQLTGFQIREDGESPWSEST